MVNPSYPSTTQQAKHACWRSEVRLGPAGSGSGDAGAGPGERGTWGDGTGAEKGHRGRDGLRRGRPSRLQGPFPTLMHSPSGQRTCCAPGPRARCPSAHFAQDNGGLASSHAGRLCPCRRALVSPRDTVSPAPVRARRRSRSGLAQPPTPTPEPLPQRIKSLGKRRAGAPRSRRSSWSRIASAPRLFPRPVGGKLPF